MTEITMQPAARTQLGVHVSPTLVATAQLLAMHRTQVEALVDDELRTNPALLRDAPAGCPLCSAAHAATRCPYCGGSGPRSTGGRSRQVVDAVAVAARRSFADRLLADAMALLPAEDRACTAQVIACLDRHGFLRGGVVGVAVALRAPRDTVARIVDALRRVGPPGLAVDGPRSWILHQLAQVTTDRPAAALARTIVTSHLQLLAAGAFETLATTLGVTRDDVVAARDLLVRAVRPYPQIDDDAREVATRVPDVAVVDTDAGDRRVVVLERRRLGLRIHPGYRRLADADVVARDHVADATRLLTRLEQRWETMHRVASCVARIQRGFLDDPRVDPQPLSRAHVARLVGRHESTVSRATADRCVLAPDGRVLGFDRLFAQNDAALRMLRRLVSAEERPLSDGLLARRMAARGHPVARRTVAKYRQRLGIPSVRER